MTTEITPAITLKPDMVGFPVQADNERIGYANKLRDNVFHLYVHQLGYRSGYYHLIDGHFVWSDEQRQDILARQPKPATTRKAAQ